MKSTVAVGYKPFVLSWDEILKTALDYQLTTMSAAYKVECVFGDNVGQAEYVSFAHAIAFISAQDLLWSDVQDNVVG